MADIVSPSKRSQMMAGIKGKNTKPELMIRRALHAQGFRYRLHDKKLAGKPDIVLPKYRAVIFVHGCFWHGHDCQLFKLPSTRTDFWREKIAKNAKKDQESTAALLELGWRVAEVWECAIRGKNKQSIRSLADQLSAWLHQETKQLRLKGH